MYIYSVNIESSQPKNEINGFVLARYGILIISNHMYTFHKLPLEVKALCHQSYILKIDFTFKISTIIYHTILFHEKMHLQPFLDL